MSTFKMWTLSKIVLSLLIIHCVISISNGSIGNSYFPKHSSLKPNDMKIRNINIVVETDDLEGNKIVSREEETSLASPSRSTPNSSYNPIVLWHGMGDTAVGIKFALRFLNEELPGIYIKSLQLGSNPAKDMESGYFLNVNDQVETVCETIRQDPKLQGGYNGIGFSQGGQFLRAVAQRCPDPPMLNLISVGGQHQGVFGLPKCSAPKHEWCEIIDKLLSHVAYADWVQKFLVQAEYWHDPFQENDYIEHSVFLADINNERTRNNTYKENLLKLKNLVLIKFTADTIVQPKETEWFGYFNPGQDKTMFTLEESALYQEDWIGLKALKESGRLHLLAVNGDHLQFTKKWFKEQIMTPYLA